MKGWEKIIKHITTTTHIKTWKTLQVFRQRSKPRQRLISMPWCHLHLSWVGLKKISKPMCSQRISIYCLKASEHYIWVKTLPFWWGWNGVILLTWLLLLLLLLHMFQEVILRILGFMDYHSSCFFTGFLLICSLISCISSTAVYSAAKRYTMLRRYLKRWWSSVGLRLR